MESEVQLECLLVRVCKRRHRLLFSCHITDAHLCELVSIKNGVLFPFLYFFFLIPLISCINSLFVVFSDKVNVNREMMWRVHCLAFLLCYKVE